MELKYSNYVAFSHFHRYAVNNSGLEKELLERIGALLKEEPERTRNIVKLRLEGYSFYEIGKQQGISESSVEMSDT